MNLMTKEKEFSTLKHLVEVAITKPDSEVSAKQKKRMKAVLDSGYLEREVEVINKPVEQQIDDYFTAAVAEAVKQGRLPKQAPRMKLLNNKGKQYARRKREQLKKLAMGEVSNVAGDPSKGPQGEGQHQGQQSDGGFLHTPGR